MGHDKKLKPEYLLLNSPETGERATNILGAVVLEGNTWAPFRSYRPNMDPRVLDQDAQDEIRALWADIWADDSGAVPISNYTRSMNKDSDSEASIRILNLLKTFAHSKKGEEVEIVAGLTKRFTLDNPDANLRDRYIKCAPWFEEVTKLWEESRKNKTRMKKLCLVTAVQVCWDLQVRFKSSSEAGFRAGGGVPNSATGEPAPGNVIEGEASRQSRVAHSGTETLDGKVVFAVRYDTLKPVVQRSQSRFWPSWFSNTSHPDKLVGFTLGPMVPGDLGGTSYGADETAPTSDFYTLPQRYVLLADPSEDEEEHAVPNGHVVEQRSLVRA